MRLIGLARAAACPGMGRALPRPTTCRSRGTDPGATQLPSEPPGIPITPRLRAGRSLEFRDRDGRAPTRGRRSPPMFIPRSRSMLESGSCWGPGSGPAPGRLPVAALLRGSSGTKRTAKLGAVCKKPRESASSSVAQRCLHGSPCGLKYGQVHEARSFAPRSRTRTRYLVVPRTLATTSLGLADIKLTRPLEKYDWPRERTASLKFRATFWAIPIFLSPSDGPFNPTLKGHSSRLESSFARSRPV